MDRAALEEQWHTGRRLADQLLELAPCRDLLVFGIPGEAMMMAAAIAEHLDAPLELLRRRRAPAVERRAVVLADDGRRLHRTAAGLERLRAGGPRLLVLVTPRLCTDRRRVLACLADVLVTDRATDRRR